jgi:hypothetical protein
MARSSGQHAVMGNRTIRRLEERYLEFSARSGAAFERYPQVEPLRFFVFRELLVQRRADGVKDHVKHWVRPFLRRAHTRAADRRADVLIWLETEREVIVDALLPVYRELVARDVRVDLLSFTGPANLPVPNRAFAFPARARLPGWARGAWDALCECEEALRDRALERSFYHICAMLQGLYDELDRVLETAAPKVVLCASTQAIGGAALIVASQRLGIDSLLLQHGMLGPDHTPVQADLMLLWGPSSEEIVVSLGVPRARLLSVGSPRHDPMRPSGNGQARVALLRALGLSERPTFVFFSQGNALGGNGDAAAECACWLEEMAAQYANALNVVVRLHVNEDGAVYRRCPHVTVMNRAVDLAITLEGCDWIGSMYSTVLYDGLLYGKQPWQFYADHWPVPPHNWRQGLALRVSSERHLSDMVRHMLSQGAAARVDEALVARVFANHGRATQAVADVVASRLMARPANPLDPSASNDAIVSRSGLTL